MELGLFISHASVETKCDAGSHPTELSSLSQNPSRQCDCLFPHSTRSPLPGQLSRRGFPSGSMPDPRAPPRKEKALSEADRELVASFCDYNAALAKSAQAKADVLEEAGLAAGGFAVEIFVGAGGGHAPAGGAVDHADLHQVGLVHFFDGVFFFAEGGG